MICWLFPREYSDFASLSQPLDDLSFVVCVVDAGLPELPGVAVLLPVVVPVSPAVRPEAKHIHLQESQRVSAGKLLCYYKCVSLQDEDDASAVSA